MDARLKGQANDATQLLDENGKKAYGVDGLSLLIAGDPHFTRYYVLTQGQVGTQPDTVRVVVRLVLTHGKLDVSSFEETLTLVREAKTRLFFIDQAAAGARQDLGRGAQVVSVEVTADTVKVTFDSDLDPGTVSDGIHILDAKGKQVDAAVTYSNRTVTLGGLDLKEGAKYRLVVLTAVRDVLGHNIATEYGLDLFGPSVRKHGSHRDVAVPNPVGAPSPVASPGATA
jgi:Big-like domain-containing protein